MLRVFVKFPALAVATAAAAGTPPSRKETPARARVIDFVAAVTDPGSDSHVFPDAR